MQRASLNCWMNQARLGTVYESGVDILEISDEVCFDTAPNPKVLSRVVSQVSPVCFGAFCLAVRTLPFCQPMGFLLDH